MMLWNACDAMDKGRDFRQDSSLAKYKFDYYKRPYATTIRRVPVSITPSLLRLPLLIRNSIMHVLKSPVVLFFHPWEFVDLRREKLRWDCRFRTGVRALVCLKSVLGFFQKKKAVFLKICELNK